MKALLRAEGRKLVTTRSSVAIIAVAMAYPAMGVLALALAPGNPTVDSNTVVQIVRGAADVVNLSALTLGILAMAGEYRHGTIVPTLLVSPRRRRMVEAKLATLAMSAAAVSLVASAVGLAAGAVYLRGRGVSVDVMSGDVLVTVMVAALIAGTYATIGVALAALIKNQTAAVAGALVWVLTIENVVPVVLHKPGLKSWLPGGAADRILHLTENGSEWGASALLGGFVIALACAAVTATRHADVH